MNKNHYIIWKVRQSSQAEWNEVVGLFHGTYEEADEVVAKLIAADPDQPTWRSKYFRTEPCILDAATVKEICEEMRA